MPTKTWPTRFGAKIARRKMPLNRSFLAFSSIARPRLSGSCKPMEKMAKIVVFQIAL